MFLDGLAKAKSEIDACLDSALADLPRHRLTDAMRHAVRGGKRMRGYLVLEGAALHGIPASGAVRAAAAVECLHAYSLVHDDLPCMDDDDLRRGLPTVHAKWNEATAVLAGDALQSLAFQILCDSRTCADPDIRASLARSLAEAAGAAGMALGQAMDLEAETAERNADIGTTTLLQQRKTGMLISWSCRAGPLLAGADPKPLERYAEALGLAYQIADDLLDATGNPEVVGKPLRKDSNANKATFVAILGVQESRRRAEVLVRRACDALEPYGSKADALREAAEFAINRTS